ncbi:hypothetical protein [Actinocorallia longicatena]|uniref:Lipoprotein n=1 Tax=Actinocorallia longicatena TaxID=111803 RepID=A0ABP6PVB5_9ACTN
MMRILVGAAAALVLMTGCSAERVPPRDAAEIAEEVIGDPLPTVDPYTFNGPRELAGWPRDRKLEKPADFTRLASGLPRKVRDRLTGVKAGYYAKPGSTRLIDRFFYVSARLRTREKPAEVVREIDGIIDGYGRRTVSTSSVSFDDPAIRGVHIDFGLAAFGNPFEVGGPVPTTYGSLVWTDGRTLHLLTAYPGDVSVLLELAGKIKKQRS